MNRQEQRISQLLRRFDEGTTTLDEERELDAYFATARDIRPEWEVYRQMFAYFDAGMPAQNVDSTEASVPRIVGFASRLRHSVAAIAAAAAVVAVVFILWPNQPESLSTSKPMAQTIAPEVITPAKPAAEPTPKPAEDNKKASIMRHKANPKKQIVKAKDIVPAKLAGEAETTPSAPAAPQTEPEKVLPPLVAQHEKPASKGEDLSAYTPHERELMEKARRMQYKTELYISEMMLSEYLAAVEEKRGYRVRI
ncbi:MAG: hypothetical protein SPL64_04130 [Bacteroidaceae bacterium]|nr:hypothetical protein [Bacteroidaceae bacterium]